jgi:3-methylfumaryl-CoA hydratase
MGEDLQAAVGRQRVREGLIAHGEIEKLAAVMGRGAVPQYLPPAWHWASLLEAVPQADIGEDGHPRRGAFLPAVDLPRRMFAGARMRFLRPVTVGAAAVLTETVRDVSEKTGKSGRLVFVEVERVLSQKGEAALSETQTLVYREAATAPQKPAPALEGAPPEADWRDEVRPDPALLFRFSAVTFNAHRIHYDRDYATKAEFYPGLVVHGPLIALSLLEAFHRRHQDAVVKSFEFKAQSPLFDDASFFVCGRGEAGGARLFAQAANGAIAMQASVEFD